MGEKWSGVRRPTAASPNRACRRSSWPAPRPCEPGCAGPGSRQPRASGEKRPSCVGGLVDASTCRRGDRWPSGSRGWSTNSCCCTERGERHSQADCRSVPCRTKPGDYSPTVHPPRRIHLPPHVVQPSCCPFRHQLVPNFVRTSVSSRVPVTSAWVEKTCSDEFTRCSPFRCSFRPTCGPFPNGDP